MNKTEIYLDNSATTRVFPEVVSLMSEIMTESYGNPSSMHHKGVEAEKAIRNATEDLASILKCDRKNIYYTSGGTESDNMAIIGAALSLKRRGMHLITTRIEHPAVLNTMKYLETQGYQVTYLPVDSRGVVDLKKLDEAIGPETILVSIMHTNNEIGSLQPLQRISEIIKAKNQNTLFHVDAVQGFGKAIIAPKKFGIDLMSISSHKIHGPKGMGALYVGDKVRLIPINYGGGQQNGLRSGTENVPGICGMSRAARMLYDSLDSDIEKLYLLKRRLIKGALQIDGVSANGLNTDTGRLCCEELAGKDDNTVASILMSAVNETAPHIVSLSFPGVRAEVLLHTLENDGIYVSAGSACSTHKPEPSATLKAIGLDKELLDCTLRFSMSHFSTEEEIDAVIDSLNKNLPMLRKFVRH